MKKKYLYLIVLGLFLIGLVVGSFFDYPIMCAVHDPNDKFVIVAAAIGELPAYGFIAFIGGYIFSSGIKFFKKKPVMYLLFFIGLVAVGCAVYFQANAITNINGFNLPGKILTVGVPIGIAIHAPFFVLGYLAVLKVKNKNLFEVALIIGFACAFAIGLITIWKIIICRPRYRFLIDPLQNENGAVLFHNWWENFPGYKTYVDRGIDKEQFKSFPSGHIGFVSFLVSLPYIPVLLESKNKEKLKVPLFIVGACYLFLLAFTRMRAGAHFLSDISMAGVVSISFHYVANEIVLYRSKKVEYNL